MNTGGEGGGNYGWGERVKYSTPSIPGHSSKISGGKNNLFVIFVLELDDYMHIFKSNILCLYYMFFSHDLFYSFFYSSFHPGSGF